MKVKKLFWLILTFIFASQKFCPAEDFITLDFLLKETISANPEIKMFQSKYLADKQKITIAKTPEYPGIGIEKQGEEQILSISQMFPLPPKLFLKGRVAEYESKMSEQEYNAKIRQLLAEVKRSYWRYYLTHKTIEIYQENIDLMKRFLNIAKTQYTIGKVTQIDVLKANTELSEMENALVLFKQEKISIQAELNALMNRPIDAPLGDPSPPPEKEIKYSPEELKDLSLRNNPDIKTKEFFYEGKSAAVNLSKWEWFPDIMAGIKSSNMGSQTYMVQASVPLYFWKQNSIVQTMRNEKEMSGWELMSVKIGILQMIKDLWTKYDAHKKLSLTYKTSIIPLAEQTLALTESGYRTGKNDFLDLLDSQKRYLSSNIDYYRHLTESQAYLIDLEEVVGVDFQ